MFDPAKAQEEGAEAFYRRLPAAQQRVYAATSAEELAAFVSWSRAQPQGSPPDVAAWDALPSEQKRQWVPEDPTAALAAEDHWSAIAAQPCAAEAS